MKSIVLEFEPEDNMISKRLKKTGIIILTAAMLSMSACGGDDNRIPDAIEKSGDADAGSKEPQTQDQAPADKEDVPDTDSKETAAGTYWAAEAVESGDGIPAELFLFEDGKAYYRERTLDEYMGILSYDVLAGRDITWTEDGDKIVIRQKWGWADNDSEEDVDYHELTRNGDVITFEDMILDRGKITVRLADMPDLPSKDDAEKMVGKWKLIGSALEGEMESFYSELDYLDEKMEITEKDGKYYSTFSEKNGGDLSDEWKNVGMTLTDEPLYDQFNNGFWSAELDQVPIDDNWRKITLYDDDILTMVVSNYGVHEEEDYIFISYRFYVRDDENADKNTREFFCPQKVTVSNVHELVANIKPYTEITLKGGTYDITEIAPEERTEWFFHDTVVDALFWNITANKLSLKAAEGEEVTIVTGEPYSAVLEYHDCRDIWLTDLTIGHKEDVGPCGAPVLEFDSGNHLTVSGCHLYGCGAFGIWSDEARAIEFKDSEIYGCSQGAVYLDEYAEMLFDKCSFHDNRMEECGLFFGYSDSRLYVRNSEIVNNNSAFSTMVNMYGYSAATFENCRFKGNTYGDKSYSDQPGKITFTACTFE